MVYIALGIKLVGEPRIHFQQEAKSMSVNSFRPRKFEDHEIVDGSGKVVGHIRIKPSGVLWSPKNGKDWYGVSLLDFASFVETNGKKQAK